MISYSSYSLLCSSQWPIPSFPFPTGSSPGGGVGASRRGGFGRRADQRRFGQDDEFGGSGGRMKESFGFQSSDEGTKLYINSSDVGRIIGK